MRFVFDEGKAFQAAALLARLHGGRIECATLLTLLYLADRQALIETGYPITGDDMLSTPDGPVPERIRDRMISGESPGGARDALQWTSERDGSAFSVQGDPADDRLSRYDIAVLTSVHKGFGSLREHALRDVARDLPGWSDPEGTSRPIMPERILESAGKTAAEIERIRADAGLIRLHGLPRGGIMDRDEYERRLSGFEIHVSQAKACSGILEEMFESDPDTVRVRKTYRDFFIYTRAALHNEMLLAVAKTLDSDDRTASLPNLVKAARETPEFAPGVDLAKIEGWLEEKEPVIKALTELRNKRLAHFDVLYSELEGPLLYGEFTDVLDDLRSHFVALYRAFHHVAAIMDSRPHDVRAQTGEIMRILVNRRRELLAGRQTD